MLNESELESFFSAKLPCRVIFAVVDREIAETALSDGEKKKLQEIKHERRRSSWLKGRLALKTLMRRLRTNNADPGSASGPMQFAPTEDAELASFDTSTLVLPHRGISLAHTDDLACAVGSLDSKCGLGIDLEGDREVKSATTRFYLNEKEHEQINLNSAEQTLSNDDLLRMWTVKEALFKSDLHNEGMTVARYGVDDLHEEYGSAGVEIAGKLQKFKYASKKFGKYWLSVAVALESE